MTLKGDFNKLDIIDDRTSRLWVYHVGETLDQPENKWLSHGIYSTHEKALRKCVKKNMFIHKTQIDFNEPMEQRTEFYEGEWAYYPLLEDKPNDI